MSELELIPVSEEWLHQIEEYKAEFPADRMQVNAKPDSISGMDLLEEYESIQDWIRFTKEMEGKISWYMSVRKDDQKIVGFVCLRHKLEYDDDDPEFASHIGYSVRPSERRKGYAKIGLRLALEKARDLKIDPVRIICRDINVGSVKTILACGGVYLDSLYGEESGLTINRYDIRTGEGNQTMDIEYRILNEDDYDELFALWNEVPQTKRALNPVDDTREGITSYMNRNPHTCFGAFVDGKLVGAILSGHDGRRGIIHHLCVNPAFQKKGIARTLVRKAEDALKGEGIQKIFCLVFVDNDPANAFWEKTGYPARTNLNYRNKSLNASIPTGE